MICSVALWSLRSNLSPCLQLFPLLQAPFKLSLLKVHWDFTAVGLQPALSLVILRQAIFRSRGMPETDCLLPAWVQDRGRWTNAADTVLTVWLYEGWYCAVPFNLNNCVLCVCSLENFSIALAGYSTTSFFVILFVRSQAVILWSWRCSQHFSSNIWVPRCPVSLL